MAGVDGWMDGRPLHKWVGRYSAISGSSPVQTLPLVAVLARTVTTQWQ